MKYANAFSLRLNPPEPVVKKEVNQPIRSNGPLPVRNVKKSLYTKFSVLGTAVNEACPERSMALLDLPGSGKKWVFQGESVDRVLIEKISDGRILYDDGSGRNELCVIMPETASLLKSDVGGSEVSKKERVLQAVNHYRSRERKITVPNKTVEVPNYSKEEVEEMTSEARKSLESIGGIDALGLSDEEMNSFKELGLILVDETKKSAESNK